MSQYPQVTTILTCFFIKNNKNVFLTHSPEDLFSEITSNGSKQMFDKNHVTILSKSNNINKTEWKKHANDQTSLQSEILLMERNKFLDIIYTFILERPCIKCNTECSLFLSSTKSGDSPILKIKCNCCSWKYTIIFSSQWKGRTQMIQAKIMAAFLMSGLTYENYKKSLLISDLDPVSRGKSS